LYATIIYRNIGHKYKLHCTNTLQSNKQKLKKQIKNIKLEI